jgi:type I restriction enzyme, S subunit
MSLVPKRISQLGRVITGKTPQTSRQEFFGGEYLFVTPSDLQYTHYYCRKTERTVTEEAKSALPNHFVPENAVMFTCIGATIGKCGIAPAQCLTNQQINSVIANEHTDAKFLYYLLCHNTDVVKGIGGGSATPIVSKSKFEEIEVLVPAFRDQQAIAEFLSAYDDLIENNRRRMALLEEAARQIYREWFVRLRFPGYEYTPINKGVPEGWERKTLNDICTDARETVSPAELEADTPYIGLEHIPRRSITLSEWGNAGQVISTKHRFRAGEILFGKIRPYFHKVGIALVDGVASSDAIVIRPASEDVRGLVLMVVSSDPFIAQASQTMREGSKMPRADWKLLQQHEVLVPSPSLLSMFNDTTEAIVEQLKTLAFQNRELRAARDLLLPRLMNGAIKV